MTNDYYNAFDISPVPTPGPDVNPPEPYHGIYGMPQFVTIQSVNLEQSEVFWRDGLGFFNLFAIPGQLIHLRRWAFQDVLVVPSESVPEEPPTIAVSFACVLSQIDQIAQACEELIPGCTAGPRHTPWNSVELDIITPENIRVTLTAAKPFDPSSLEAQNLAKIGITPSDPMPQS